MNAHPVAGFCPMGCGKTLVLGMRGRVTCSYRDCPDPAKVHTLLTDAETEHIVHLGETTFTVLHPLRERGGDLLACDLHIWLDELPEFPMPPGRYRAVRHADTWAFQLFLRQEACVECGDEHGEHRSEFDRVLCGKCFTDSCDEVDADRAEHAQRDEGER